MAIAPISPKTKLHIDAPGKTILFSEYAAAKVKQFPALDLKVVTGICMAAKAGEDFTGGEDLDGKKAKTQAKEFEKIAKVDFKAAKKNRATFEENEEQRKKDEKEAGEKKKAEEEKRKENDAKLVEDKLESKALAPIVQLTEKAGDAMVKALGSKIELDAKTGLIVVAEGAKKEDFAVAFATLVKQNEAGAILSDRSAKYEAQIATAAKKIMGDEWEDLLGGSARAADLSRVKKGVKTFETVTSIGKKGLRLFKSLPLSTLRALTEMKVTDAATEGDADKAIAKNLEAKKEVAALACELLDKKKELGGTVTQTDAKNIVTEYKAALGLKGKVKFKNFYIAKTEDGQTHFWGDAEPKPNEVLVKNAIFAFDSNGNLFTWIGKEQIQSKPVNAADETILKQIREWEKEMNEEEDDKKKEEESAKKGKGTKKEGKGKKESKPKATSKEDELEDDEDEEEEKKPSKKVKKEEVKEDEDEDEDEKDTDSSDDDDDDEKEDTKAAESDDDDDDDDDSSDDDDDLDE